jgi:hypothetical protein
MIDRLSQSLAAQQVPSLHLALMFFVRSSPPFSEGHEMTGADDA